MDLAIKIIRHSIAQVLGNLQMSLRVSIPYFIVAIASFVFLGSVAFNPGNDPFAGGNLGLVLLLLLASIVAGLWLAVRFHIAILRPENDNVGVADTLERCLGYFGRSLLIVLIIALPAMVVTMIAMMALASNLVFAIVAMYLIIAVAAMIMLRLSPILPAGAIDEPIKMRVAWDATSPYSISLFIVVVIGVVVSAVLEYLSTGAPFLFQLVVWGLNWLILVVGVSVYTTIYGMTVEGRELN